MVRFDKVLGSATHSKQPKEKADGHGRNSADAYKKAEVVEVPLETLKAGQACPECHKGKLYDYKARVLVRIIGRLLPATRLPEARHPKDRSSRTS